jgi:hypothetical protein
MIEEEGAKQDRTLKNLIYSHIYGFYYTRRYDNTVYLTEERPHIALKGQELSILYPAEWLLGLHKLFPVEQ